jgi:hypothetical protein
MRTGVPSAAGDRGDAPCAKARGRARARTASGGWFERWCDIWGRLGAVTGVRASWRVGSSAAGSFPSISCRRPRRAPERYR